MDKMLNNNTENTESATDAAKVTVYLECIDAACAMKPSFSFVPAWDCFSGQIHCSYCGYVMAARFETASGPVEHKDC